MKCYYQLEWRELHNATSLRCVLYLSIIFEPRQEKPRLRGLRPGKAHTSLGPYFGNFCGKPHSNVWLTIGLAFGIFHRPAYILKTEKFPTFSSILQSIHTNKSKYGLVFICFLRTCTGNFTDINLVWRHGCCQYYFQKTLKILCKRLKMTNNHLRMISLSNWTEITDRDGPLRLYFNTELPEPFSREKIPQASIILSRTWKLRFTSNSIVNLNFKVWKLRFTSNNIVNLNFQVRDRTRLKPAWNVCGSLGIQFTCSTLQKIIYLCSVFTDSTWYSFIRPKSAELTCQWHGVYLQFET